MDTLLDAAPAGRSTPTVVVVGAGVFGLAGAIELARRGHGVTVLDAGPVPHPLAASTDISKMVRMDYGADPHYLGMMEAAFPLWEAWNGRWGEPLYHQDGFLLLAGEPLRPGGFEHDSLALLAARAHPVERLDAAALAARFPAWAAAAGRYPEGYFNPRAGWAHSARVTALLAAEARAAGVAVVEGQAFDRLLEQGARVTGVVTRSGQTWRADSVLVAAGAWTPALLPQLADRLWSTGQPVVHFRVADVPAYHPPRFVPWAADIARSGWYGFPALPDGTLKVANHGPGRPIHPDQPRRVLPEEEARARAFLATTFPDLADAPVIATRLCLYCDSWDGDFLIDHDPDRPGLIVAAGDSGHGFKFAPVLGPLIADVVEGKPNPWAGRFAWRETGRRRTEHARYT
jgi:glycine/D-amino acid oxidase-like deaminating enzyme